MTTQKTALVTGGSRGIGRAIVEVLSNEGWMVVATYNTSIDEAQELKRDLGIEVRQIDLSDRSRSLDFARTISEEFTFSALVNNAGIIEFEPFEELTLDAWDRTLEVNVTAPLLLSKEIGLRMPQGSAIVNIASTDANIGSFSSIAYSASKAALLSITKSLADVLGSRGVRVNAVTPGWVNTGMSTEESYDAVELTPLGRIGRTDEIAHTVSFLLSDKASFVSGASWVVDGGYTGVDYIMKKENDGLG
jgi:NAD(P)-dependent dehydrogenase (short-subunit alcohol dehydrogenase family)